MRLPTGVLAVLLFIVAAHPASGQNAPLKLEERLIDPPCEGCFIQPTAISKRGTITGWHGSPDGLTVAFVWTETAGYVRLVTTESQAYGINSNDHVVGQWTGCETTCEFRGFRWAPGGIFQDLGPNFIPLSINDAGEMGGFCGRWACVMRDGVLTILDPAHSIAARSLNASGQAVGWSYIDGHEEGPDVVNAWMWPRNGEAVYLGFGRAIDINDSGIIVGFRDAQNVAWIGGKEVTIPVGFTQSNNDDLSVNNKGWVVGSSDLAWNAHTGVLIRLGSSLGNGVSITDINDDGWIVGKAWPRMALWRIVDEHVHITTPNTPSRWGINTRQRLSWTYAGSATQFAIDFSPEPDTWIQIDIVDNEPCTSHNYYRAITAPPTTTGRLRVRALGDPTDVDVNDADITIEPGSIGIIYPRPGSTRSFGSTERIFYTHNLGARAPVAIDVSRDGGRTWRTVAARAETNGSTTASFYWTVDLTPTTQARVRVRALDGSGAVGLSQAFAINTAAAGTVSY